MNIDNLFKQFSSLNVLIIGDVMIDSYLYGDVKRISPEAPVPVCEITRRENRLGGAANVALNIAALGAKPILCSVIGNDEHGKIFLELLKSNNLITEGILLSKRPTTIKTRVIGNKMQMLRLDEETTDYITKSEQDALISKIENIISNQNIHVIIFQDYDKGVITPKLISQIVPIATKKNIPTCVDPKHRNFSFYHGVTMFKPNFKEFKQGLDIDIPTINRNAIKKAADKLHLSQDIQKIFITLSEYGVFIADYSESNLTVELMAAHKRKITDVSGAGDTVISVASLCLALKMSAKDIAFIGNLAGGLVCEQAGVVPIDKNSLLDEIKRLQ